MNKAPVATRAPFSFLSPSGRGATPDFDLANTTDLGASAFDRIILRVRARISLLNREAILGFDDRLSNTGIGEIGDDLATVALVRKLRYRGLPHLAHARFAARVAISIGDCAKSIGAEAFLLVHLC